MSIIVYIENTEGKLKKGTLEAVSYAYALAQSSGGSLTGVSVGTISDEELQKTASFGLSKIIKVAGENPNHQSVANALKTISDSENSSTIVLSNSWMGKGVAPRLAVKMSAGIVSEVVSLPEGKTVKKKAFSGKAFVNVELTKDKNIIAIAPNSFGLKENNASLSITDSGSSASDSSLTHVSYNRDTTALSLTDAELVVSAGRGLKGPENWGMIDELATVLGAATACSKPVSDADWRPHHEHVGQTGITISPNLYIAIGISGAIQHLAGVSSSKKIVVINTDPEAPFFKAADYGIVGDAFEVVPKLVEAIRKVKS